VSLRAHDKLPPYSDPELLQIFLDIAKNMLAHPIALGGSNSPPVILSPFEVQRLHATFALISAEITSLERLTSQRAKAEAWRKIFGDCFPAVIWI